VDKAGIEKNMIKIECWKKPLFIDFRKIKSAK